MLTLINGRLQISWSINKCKTIAIIYTSNPNGYTDDKTYYCGKHYINRCKEPVNIGGIKNELF